jgi:hypothetical protein
MASLATLLALVRFDVDCVCYSAYLSERDHKDFESMFADFGVSDAVKYGTFDKLAEKTLNAEGNVRDLTCGFMRGFMSAKDGDGGQRASAGTQRSNRKRVLLIDEVDVFFKKDFYGSSYRPLATLQSKSFADLVKYAWELHGKGRCTFAMLQRAHAYTELLGQYAQYADIVVERIKQMVVDLRNLGTHEYLVCDGRIA